MVTVLQRLGLDDESVFEVNWEELDREVNPDHLTCLWISDLPASMTTDALAQLHNVVGRLRRECPWDQEQTHHSLISGLLEEAREVVEAIEVMETKTKSVAVEELGRSVVPYCSPMRYRRRRRNL